MEDIVRVPLGYIIDMEVEYTETNNMESKECFYFANMTETDIMEMYMSFIEEDWEENVQISQAYEYADLTPEDWWYDVPRKQIFHEIANRYAVGVINNVPFYNDTLFDNT